VGDGRALREVMNEETLLGAVVTQFSRGGRFGHLLVNLPTRVGVFKRPLGHAVSY